MSLPVNLPLWLAWIHALWRKWHCDKSMPSHHEGWNLLLSWGIGPWCCKAAWFAWANAETSHGQRELWETRCVSEVFMHLPAQLLMEGDWASVGGRCQMGQKNHSASPLLNSWPTKQPNGCSFKFLSFRVAYHTVIGKCNCCLLEWWPSMEDGEFCPQGDTFSVWRCFELSWLERLPSVGRQGTSLNLLHSPEEPHNKALSGPKWL